MLLGFPDLWPDVNTKEATGVGGGGWGQKKLFGVRKIWPFSSIVAKATSIFTFHVIKDCQPIYLCTISNEDPPSGGARTVYIYGGEAEDF